MSTNIASKIFDSVSKTYDIFLNFITFGYIHKLQNNLIEKTPLGENLVDIGTGTGEILKKINDKNNNSLLIGIDVSKNMLLKAKEKVPNANLLIADAENLPFKNKSIDNIFFSLVFRHLNQENTTQELKRVIKKNGYVSILDLSKNKLLLFLFDKIFKPFGRLIFSKKEYDYFIDSIKWAKSIEELEELFKKNDFECIYKKKYLFGLAIIVIFKKSS